MFAEKGTMKKARLVKNVTSNARNAPFLQITAKPVKEIEFFHRN